MLLVCTVLLIKAKKRFMFPRSNKVIEEIRMSDRTNSSLSGECNIDKPRYFKISNKRYSRTICHIKEFELKIGFPLN